MDAVTMQQIREAGNTLCAMGLRIISDAAVPDSYELLLAMANQAGKAVATLRAILESVPESQR